MLKLVDISTLSKLEKNMTVKFYRCAICGKIITMIHETMVPTVCCGEDMYELIPGTTDAATEKHVPIVTRHGNLVDVKVGSVEHPMTTEHYIQWVFLQTKNGTQLKELQPGDKPYAHFMIFEDDEIISVFEFCNLHGLWKADKIS